MIFEVPQDIVIDIGPSPEYLPRKTNRGAFGYITTVLSLRGPDEGKLLHSRYSNRDIESHFQKIRIHNT